MRHGILNVSASSKELNIGEAGKDKTERSPIHKYSKRLHSPSTNDS